ncbi:High-affinity nicotinic acid transporter, partial [Colletotrichum asianum]
MTFAEEAKNHGIIRAILESLHFTQIKDRQNEIPKAHKDTFEWIFSENTSGNFSNWLRDSSGIFWITGKPGSGKSTLMKFISGHEMTKSLANIWAGPKQLLFASHFFWFGGTKLQKSQEGLLRTLLFQISSNAPQLISKVFPDRVSGQFQYLESWSLEELSDAFKRLQALPNVPYRILILVDGLDEYSGQGTELTTFLQAITKSTEIKVCCASRPWQEFRDGFSNAFGQIQMHNLTSEDMRLYVQHNLRQNEQFKTLQSSQEAKARSLMNSICAKAGGVFFWVSLVVKSIVRGLNNNDGLEILQRRVSEFPPDLEQFFKRMIDSIEEVYKKEVGRVFSMLLMVNAPLPLILFRARDSDLIRDMESRNFVTTTTSTEFKFSLRRRKPIQETSTVSKRKQIIIHGELDTGDPGINTTIYDPNGLYVHPQDPLLFRDQLLSRCRDLIQAWQAGPATDDIRLGFLHRTEANRPVTDHQTCLDRFFLARSCLCVLSSANDILINRDFILWFLYILQETRAPTGDLAHDDAYMLFRQCEKLVRMLNYQKAVILGEDDEVDGILRLLALSQARILIKICQFELTDPHTKTDPSDEERWSFDILDYVLQGSGHVE